MVRKRKIAMAKRKTYGFVGSGAETGCDIVVWTRILSLSGMCFLGATLELWSLSGGIDTG